MQSVYFVVEAPVSWSVYGMCAMCVLDLQSQRPHCDKAMHCCLCRVYSTCRCA